MPLKIVETKYDLNINRETTDHISRFKRKVNQFWVNEKIKPILIFPDIRELVISPPKYYFGDDGIDQNEFTEMKKEDKGNKAIYATVSCKTELQQVIQFKFKKNIEIKSLPFKFEAKKLGSYVSGLPGWIKIPFFNIRGLSNKINLPFTCNIEVDKLILIPNVKPISLKKSKDIITVSKSDKELVIEALFNKLPAPGEYNFTLYLDSREYLDKPLQYDYNLKIIPLWKFILYFTLVASTLAYITLLVLFYIKGSEGTKTSGYIFPLRFIPLPGRWEIIKDNHARKIGKVGLCLLPFFGRTFKVKSYDKNNQPAIYNIANCVIVQKRCGFKKQTCIQLINTQHYSFQIAFPICGTIINVSK